MGIVIGPASSSHRHTAETKNQPTEIKIFSAAAEFAVKLSELSIRGEQSEQARISLADRIFATAAELFPNEETQFTRASLTRAIMRNPQAIVRLGIKNPDGLINKFFPKTPTLPMPVTATAPKLVIAPAAKQ